MNNAIKIKFLFDYNCTPIWLSGDNYGDWLISSNGYFYSDLYDSDGQKIDKRVTEERLKGETELEEKVKMIYQIHNKLFDINKFPNGEPYLGFENDDEEKRFFDACNYVIQRMGEIFEDDFIISTDAEKIIRERGKLNC